MRHNVPRLGPSGGYVHAETGRFECPPPLIAFLLARDLQAEFVIQHRAGMTQASVGDVAELIARRIKD
jgi:hypothetical protein